MTGRARANGEGSIFPYRNGYAAYAWVRTPSGRRQKKWVYGKTRDEVHDKWINLQNMARDGTVATRTPTVGEYVTYWLEEIIKPNRAPLTYQTYETFVRVHIIPALGAKNLTRLQVRDVQQWINKLAATCQCCAQGKDARRPVKKRRCCATGSCCEDVLSRRSVGDVRAALRAALSHAVKEELIGKNVAMSVTLPKNRKRARRRKAWTTDEARAFLESARADEDRLYAAHVLVLVLGLRKGEVLGTCWDDLDLDAGTLSIGMQLQRVGRRLLHRETKTEESESDLPLPQICTTALTLRRAEQQLDREKAGPAWQGDKLVFTTRYGTPIEPRNFNRSWDARCAKAGVRKITVHDGRRSCGTLLADLDVHPRVAMQILRHADFALTMEIYTLASSAATRDALKRLGESLDGPQ
jgi:integrase